jgi:hypothetical protein
MYFDLTKNLIPTLQNCRLQFINGNLKNFLHLPPQYIAYFNGYFWDVS